MFVCCVVEKERTDLGATLEDPSSARKRGCCQSPRDATPLRSDRSLALHPRAMPVWKKAYAHRSYRSEKSPTESNVGCTFRLLTDSILKYLGPVATAAQYVEPEVVLDIDRYTRIP